MQAGQMDNLMGERVHQEALAAGAIFAGSRHKKPPFRRSHAANMVGAHLLRHPLAAHSNNCPWVKKLKNLYLGSMSSGSGGGRLCPCTAARQCRHMDRTAARSARQGRKRSTMPRMSARMNAHGDATAAAASWMLVVLCHFSPSASPVKGASGLRA